jgi:hypothetical protein
MTNGQFEREKNYGVVMAVARMMLSKGLISEKDYRKIDTIYSPILSLVYFPCKDCFQLPWLFLINSSSVWDLQGLHLEMN